MFTVDSSLLLRSRLSSVTMRGFVMALALSGFVLGSGGVSFAQDSDAPAAEAVADHDQEAEGDPGHDEEHAEHSDSDHGTGSDEHAAGVPPLLQFDFGSAICNLAIFLAVFAILSTFVWPVILEGLKAREQKIHGDLVAAEKANADAKALLDDYQTQLSEASTKVQTMLAEARKDAETNGQKIVDEAKAEAQRQTERAVADIDTAKKVALSELAGQTSDMAMAVAGQVVGRELQAGDHAELIRQSLQRLPSDN